VGVKKRQDVHAFDKRFDGQSKGYLGRWCYNYPEEKI
jgi:hypothetical protein